MSPFSRNGRVFWTTAATVIVLDVLTKALANRYLIPKHVPHPIVGDVVRFTLAYNPGAAFSMSVGDYSRYIFGAFAVIALGILWWMYRSSGRGDTWRVLALGLAWGGAAGNLLDRIRSPLGVVDFIDIGVGEVRFWTFNVADSAVTVGAILLALVLWREDSVRAAVRAAEAAAGQESQARGAAPTVSESGPPREPARHQFTAPEGALRLDLLVARQLDLSRNQAATLIAEGRVRVGGRRERASYLARAGEVVDVEIPPPPGRDVLPEAIPLRILYEDDDILVVDKAAGMVVHPAPGNWSGTLVNALLGRGGPLSSGAGEGREGIVHRLDKETSGLLLVARSDRAHRVLGAALQARRIVRRYAALCWGHLADERITVERPIARDPRDRTRMAVVSTGRPARTDFTRLARFDSADLLRAHLYTGRTHQIRVHLASIGHPVVGDDTYGGGGGRRLIGLPPRRHFLHAAWLMFQHPVTGAALDIRSPLPEDLRRALAAAAGADVDFGHLDPLDYFGFYRID